MSINLREKSPQEIAKYIQFTKTSPVVTRDEMVKHYEQCAEYGFNAAMVPMCWVSLGKEILKGTDVNVATFFGFGMGHETLASKIAMMRECLASGADEVDYQPNMSYLLSGMLEEFQNETKILMEMAESMTIKPMFELGLVPTDEGKIEAIKLLCDCGLKWIKNSSGASTGGGPATPEDIAFLRKYAPEGCKVKASGGVKSFEKMVSLFDAGAELTGTSSGLDIIQKGAGTDNSY